ncbi:SRPBCC family protein [Altericista sp. CCNU0014]|uniref:SRPBCC family protein n=1 Tax=Altericista sp. CCNU0014 TaxID=3082949 RepID=UPI00384BC337
MVAADNISLSELSRAFAPEDSAFFKLLQGEVVLKPRAYNALGGAITAQMYLPIARSLVWQQITDYTRWVQFFPDIVRSEILESNPLRPHRGHRLYQAARKNFLVFTAQVEIHLRVFENLQRQIRFRMERGSFDDFSAELTLDDCGDGTILTYSVEATPLIPVPSLLIEQAMRHDLPGNMRQMRQVICAGVSS